MSSGFNCARFNAARDLFETIEGRFDAGVLIGEPARRRDAVAPEARTFLGFEVDDLEVIRLARETPSARRGARGARDQAA